MCEGLQVPLPVITAPAWVCWWRGIVPHRSSFVEVIFHALGLLVLLWVALKAASPGHAVRSSACSRGELVLSHRRDWRTYRRIFRMMVEPEVVLQVVH